MSAGCLFHCRHPLWGGDGICITDDDGDPTADAACSCGAGFISRDGAGYPSCVPKVTLVAGYTILGVSGLVTAAFLLLHANRYRYLPPHHRRTRRAAIRIRALVSSSGGTLAVGLVGLSLAISAGETTLWDQGAVQGIYCAYSPLALFFCAMVAGLWVESLPSQLLPPNSIGGKLKEASEKHDLFCLIGWSIMCMSLVVGTMTFFFDPLWPARIGDAFGAMAGAGAAALIIYVAAQMTRFINITSSAKASASSRDFYAKAKKNIWSQAAALGTIGFFYAAVVAVRHLTVAGRGTPLLFNMLQYGAAFVAFSVFADFTSFNPASERFEALASIARPKFPKAFFRLKTVAGVAKNSGTAAAVVPI